LGLWLCLGRWLGGLRWSGSVASLGLRWRVPVPGARCPAPAVVVAAVAAWRGGGGVVAVAGAWRALGCRVWAWGVAILCCEA